MDGQYVEGLRRAEIALALGEIGSRKPPGATIVEIGGGAGWQACIMSEAG
jgi:protein-L-isoaspartate O-methyltransferase